MAILDLILLPGRRGHPTAYRQSDGDASVIYIVSFFILVGGIRINRLFGLVFVSNSKKRLGCFLAIESKGTVLTSKGVQPAYRT